MVKLWWEIYRSETCIFANVFVNLFVMDLEGAIFPLRIYFFFFFVASINWRYCISSASYDVDV